MADNLVICSDGTGNTFTQRQSNVSALVRALDLTAAARQVAVYDQGLGTNPHLVRAVHDFKREGGAARTGLIIADAPGHALPRPLSTLLGLAAGYGLRENVAQLYRALAQHHTGDDTRLFLFGFSRGAFTVRALAGLLYRCGLPPRRIADDDEAFAACFAAAWDAYRPHVKDDAALAALTRVPGWRFVDVHFLGLWDTVKSYGGLCPVSLPHLRHNPIVQRVCHALALDECRSWFLATTWGGVATDTGIQLPVPPDARYGSQSVQEVWFRGCHSDIGGGDEAGMTGRIALRWMLGEATAGDHGLRLGADAPAWLFDDTPAPPPVPHESNTVGWRCSDWIPRWELENTQRPPLRPFRWRGHGRRDLTRARRGGVLTKHVSAVCTAPASTVCTAPDRAVCAAHACAGFTEGPEVRIVSSQRPRRPSVHSGA